MEYITGASRDLVPIHTRIILNIQRNFQTGNIACLAALLRSHYQIPPIAESSLMEYITGAMCTLLEETTGEASQVLDMVLPVKPSGVEQQTTTSRSNDRPSYRPHNVQYGGWVVLMTLILFVFGIL